MADDVAVGDVSVDMGVSVDVVMGVVVLVDV